MGVITIDAYCPDLPAGKIGFRGEVKVHASALAGRLQDVSGLGCVPCNGSDVGVGRIEGGGEVLIKGSLYLKIIGKPDQLTIGDRAQVAYFFL